MNSNNRLLTIGSCATVLALLPVCPARAEFLEDSHMYFDARNFYMNRDFRDPLRDAPARRKNENKKKSEEWGQSLVLRFESGFTDGLVGYGLDTTGVLGIKLDGGGGTRGAGSWPYNYSTGKSPDEVTYAGVAAKAKISKTQVAVGTVQPYLPILWRNDSRLLTQTFEGAYLQSEDVKDAKIQAGHLVSTRLRDSSGNSEMLAFADGITGGVKSDSFDFVGGNYTFSPTLSAAYYYSNLESNYDQHYVGLIHKLPITDKVTFSSQFRYFKSENLGQTNVDNRYAGAIFTLYNGVHSVALGYQDLSGETGFPYVAGGADPYTFNSMLYSVFLRTNEKSWQAKYEFDFASVGLPGLSLVSRYVEGDGFKVAGQSAKESEVDVDLAYVVQSGPLQGLRFQWRTGKYWSDRLADGDENRFIVNYTYKFW